jgi:uncharacterized protein YjbI with pentapeptide repeats
MQSDGANLSGSDLTHAALDLVNLNGTLLVDSNFSEMYVNVTTFGNLNLSKL